MKAIKTRRNFRIGLFYIDDDGTRVFIQTFTSFAKAEKDAKEILDANDMIGREYLIALCDDDNEITREIYYVRLVLNEEHEREFVLAGYSY